MIKKYKVLGLDCPNCTMAAEKMISTLGFIEECSLSYTSGILKVKLKNNIEEKALITKIQEMLSICDKNFKLEVVVGNAVKKKNIFSGSNIIVLIGVVFGVLAFIFEKVLTPSFEGNAFWINLLLYLPAYFLIGHKILFKCAKNVARGRIFDENFLMTIASFGAFALGEFDEAILVMLLFTIGENFQNYAVQKSVSRIKNMLNTIPQTSIIYDENGFQKTVQTSDIKVGDIILIKAGERVPVDCVLLSNNAMFETSSLTGESMPLTCKKEEKILSGYINMENVITARAERVLSDSTATKILDLIQDATTNKSKSEQFITRFAKIYTPIVTAIAVLIALLPLTWGAKFTANLNTALVFLLISCPCSLVISVPLAYFAALGTCSKLGAIFKGSNYLATLAEVDTMIFDKTGTLTTNTLDIQDISPANENISKDYLLYIAAHAESLSTHPIARSILKSFKGVIKEKEIQNYKEITGHGITLNLGNDDVIIGKQSFLEANGIKCNSETALTTTHVAVDSKYIGYISLASKIKENTTETLKELRKCGVKNLIMLTGDEENVAKYIAQRTGIDSVYAKVLPEDKLKIVENRVNTSRKKTAFIGDGINDVLAVTRADIGISCGYNADAVVENADLVLADDNLNSLLGAKKMSLKTRKIVVENIAFSLLGKLAIMILSFFITLPLFVAVIADVGFSLICVANSLRLIRKNKLKKEEHTHTHAHA